MGAADQTLPGRFFAEASRRAGHVAHHYRSGTTWFPVGWATMAQLVRDLAGGLIALGHQPSQPVAIAASSRREWLYCDLAILACGGISVGIPPGLEPGQCARRLAHAGARLCVVDSRRQLAALRPHFGQLPQLHTVIVLDDGGDGAEERPERGDSGTPQAGRVQLIAYREVLGRGRGRAAEVAARVAAIRPLDAAMFLYTSGTAGEPRGAMLTHGNAVAAVRALARLGVGPEDTALSMVPPDHALHRAWQHCGLWSGMRMVFAGEPELAMSYLMDIKPTVVIAMPGMVERIYRAFYHEMSDLAGGRQLFQWACELTRRRTERRRRGAELPIRLRAQLGVARRAVFEVLRERLGGQVRCMVVMGGPIAHGVGDLFEAAGVRVMVGWGMAETLFAGTLSRDGNHLPERIGEPLPGIELTTTAEGELLIRGGSVFSGYYKAGAETISAFTDGGYLRTGDLGRRGADGSFYLSDRKRDRIITASGQTVATQRIEAWLRGDPRISWAVVIGHERPYLTGLIAVPETIRLRCDDAELATLVERIVGERNLELRRAEQLRAHRVLPYDLGVASGELTPALQVRRDVVLDRFRYLIDEMYE
ncbi:MAG: AMP-binding protein [Myxococcota bacterium]